jgi:ribosomal protein S1
VFRVRVLRLMDYGAFVELPNGFQALLHISELAHHRVRAPLPRLWHHMMTKDSTACSHPGL